MNAVVLLLAVAVVHSAPVQPPPFYLGAATGAYQVYLRASFGIGNRFRSKALGTSMAVDCRFGTLFHTPRERRVDLLAKLSKQSSG